MKNTFDSKPKYFVLTLYKKEADGDCVARCIKTHSKNKFSRKLKQIEGEFYAHLRITYNDNAWNDGVYQNKSELLLAYKAFTET